MNNAMLDFCAIVVGIAYLLVFAFGVFAVGYGILYGITYIWHEDLIDDTFEVVVLEKVMTNDDGVECTVLVEGVDLNGNKYCETLSISVEVYASIAPNDTLLIRHKSYTQPIFGTQNVYTLVEPQLATN